MNQKQVLRSQPVALLLQSTECDFAEARINLDRPNIASDDIAKILTSNRSSNLDRLHLLKNAFLQLRSSNGIRFLKMLQFYWTTTLLSQRKSF